MNAPLLPALPGYEDPQLIAHGTTALVFRAIQTRLNRPVAIKVITADTGSGSVPVNVERELATTVSLSSQPHIVSIIDTGVTDDDRRYIVMEYCEGGSLAQILRQRGPLPIDDVVEVGIKIGQALHAAHLAGIVHRDVKPSNILRSRFGPALTDFGIARAPDELGSTLTREMMTPHHASPEALLHQAQSGISDVFSLASTMWTLLVGHPPFVDPTKPDMDMYTFRDRVLHDPLPPMPREDVPEWLAAELRRAMAKLPAQRPGSALEFSEALQRGSLGLPAPAPIPQERGPIITRPSQPASTEGQIHVPGMPAQAWPATETPANPQPAPSAGPVPPPRYPSPEPEAAEPEPVRSPAPAATRLPAPPLPHPPAAPPLPSAVPSAPPASPPRPLAPPPPRLVEPTEPAPVFGPAQLYRPGPVTGTARPVVPPVHPLGADRPAPPPVEQGGWLGPRPEASTQMWPEPVVEPVQPRPHRGGGVATPSSGRRGGLVAVLVGVLLIAAASGALLLLKLREQALAAPPPDPGASSIPTVTAGTGGAVDDLRIEEDRGTSVTLAWTDTSGGALSFFAIMRLADSDEEFSSEIVEPGAAEKFATFVGLDAGQDYCFHVVTVYSVNDFATSPQVCTRR